MRFLFGELGCHQFRNGAHQCRWKIPATDTGLIRDDDNGQLCTIELPDGLCREWKHTKAADVIQVACLLGDRSVAIEENGWTQRGDVTQKPPPSRGARHALRLRRILA